MTWFRDKTGRYTQVRDEDVAAAKLNPNLDEVVDPDELADLATTGGGGGTAATIRIGTVTTLAAGSSATVSNSGSTTHATFDFGIPRGEKGERGGIGIQGDRGERGVPGPAGNPGPAGADGATPTLIIGAVTPIPATAAPSATLTETAVGSHTYRLDLNIPRGEQGETAVAALNPRGDWQNDTPYAKNDYVTASDGNTYVLGVDSSIGQDPTITTGIWQLIALRGARGETGIQGPQGDPGQPGQPGSRGDPGERGSDGIDGIDGVTPTLTMGTISMADADAEPQASLTETAANVYALDLVIPRGQSGQNATINIGTVTTLDAGEQAAITNTGTASSAILNFSLPKGDTGASGATPTLQIGTVTQVEATAAPSAILTETPTGSHNYRLELSIPKGAQGENAVSAINPRGIYSPTTPYNKGDYTTASDGNAYVLIADTSIGQDPTTTTGIWQLIALRGAPGSQGIQGVAGTNATVAIGTVTTLPAGADATVTNSGTPSAAVFNFGIPQGEAGGGGGGEVTISQEPHNRLSQKADGLYADGIGLEDLTEIPGELPTTQQMAEFNNHLAATYVKMEELSEIDFDGLVARVAALEAKVNGGGA